MRRHIHGFGGALANPGEFSLVIESITPGTRPAAAMGTAVTPVQNATNGAYAQLISGANLTYDCYAIEINVNNIGINTVARDALATLGIDESGGTSYTGIVDLLVGNAAPYNGGNAGGGGMAFWFPLRIPAGTSIGMRGSVNSSNLTAFNAFCRCYCRPTRPVRYGRYIEQFGIDTANSTGVAVTAGTSSEGTYTAIGSAVARPLWFFEFGFGNNDGTDSSNTYDVDIAVGDAGTKKQIMWNRPVFTNTNENVAKPAAPTWARAAVGDIVYARTQVGPASADTHAIAVYGVGG